MMEDKFQVRRDYDSPYLALNKIAHRLNFQDIQGWLKHNHAYVQRFVQNHPEAEPYLTGSKKNNYGGITNGDMLEKRLKEKLEDMPSEIFEFLPMNFALSYALDSVQPDRVIAIANGAVGHAATAEYFGKKVEFVEAHPRGKEVYEKETPWQRERNGIPFYEEHLDRPIQPGEKVLIIEDTSDGGLGYNDSVSTTYSFVREKLIQNHNISKGNISFFFGLPGHGIQGIANEVRTPSPEEREEAKKVFYPFIENEVAYFLPHHIPTNIDEIRPQDWTLFKKLSERKDLDQALQRFVERIKGNHAISESS